MASVRLPVGDLAWLLFRADLPNRKHTLAFIGILDDYDLPGTSDPRARCGEASGPEVTLEPFLLAGDVQTAGHACHHQEGFIPCEPASLFRFYGSTPI